MPEPPKKKVRPQRFCIFCGKPGLSKEHIFAQWLHRYLPKSGEVNHFDRKVMIHRDGDKVDDRLRAGDGHSGTIKVVCVACNTGWMSALQEEAKPFLLPLVLGQTIPLFIRQQSILAAWATMFTMVIEHRQDDPNLISSTEAERRSFMADRKAPARWKIWIGHYERTRWVPIVARSTAQVVSDAIDGAYVPEDGVIAPNTHATTFVVGKLFFHAFGSAIPGVVRKQEIASVAMPRIWPFKASPIWWPPPVTLTDRDADSVAHAFTARLRRIRKDLDV